MGIFTIFGDIKRFVRSPRLEEESVTAIFGDVKLDFTRCPFVPGDYQMRVFTVFGDIRLRMPHDVGVETDGFTLFGDVEVENTVTGDEEEPGTNYVTENFASAAVRIQLNVFTLFGDVKLIRLPVPIGGSEAAVGATARLIGDGNERFSPESYGVETVDRRGRE